MTINGITLKGNSSAEYGGGLYNDYDLTLTHGSFSNNTAEYGGGMFNEYDATVNGTTFQQNSASVQGGGLYNHTSDTLNLTGSTVAYNHAPAGAGGGIYNDGTVNLTNTLVRFNTVNNCSPALSVTGCTG